MVVFRNANPTLQPGKRGSQRRCHAVISAGCHRDGIKTPSQGIHGLGESNSILLRAGRIAAFEFKVNLAQTDFAFDIASSDQRRIPYFRIKNVFIGLQTLIQRHL